MSFYDKESEEYQEYNDAFHLSIINILFNDIKRYSYYKASLPQTLDLEKSLQGVLLTLSVPPAGKSYVIPSDFDKLSVALKNYYDNLGAVSSDKQVIKNQNINDLEAASLFVLFCKEVYGELKIELFDLLASYMNFDVIRKFHEICNSDPKCESLNSKFMAWLNALLEIPDTKLDPSIKANFEKGLDDLSKKLKKDPSLIGASKLEEIEKTIVNLKENIRSPSDSKSLANSFDQVINEDLLKIRGLHDTCEGFMKVHFVDRQTRRNAILFFLLYNLSISHELLPIFMKLYDPQEKLKNLLKSYFSTDSTMLYLTFSWMRQIIPSFKSADFSFFWRNSVYKLKLLIKLDSELKNLKSNLPNHGNLNFDMDFEDNKSLSNPKVAFLIKKELRSIIDKLQFVPEYFKFIRNNAYPNLKFSGLNKMLEDVLNNLLDQIVLEVNPRYLPPKS